MATLSKETRMVQNPALGSLLIWRFVVGFEKGNEVPKGTPFPLIFIVLPIIFHPEMCAFAKSTLPASGLRAFAGKFVTASASKSDLLLSINRRAMRMRKLTFDSLSLALSTHLVTISADEGLVISLSNTPPKTGIPGTISILLKVAEKLGAWCSQISLHEVSIILKVGF